jgi:sigma-E factor negative regulatory protein RseA
MDKISALMDGELDARESGQQYSRLKHDADARACWETYHLIGDALRGECMVSKKLSGGLVGDLGTLLAQEPTVLAPQRGTPNRVAPSTYAWSVAASLSAVALVGWIAVNNPLSPQPELAKAPVTTPSAPVIPASAPVQLASVPSDGTMNEYLMAHQEFSPSTAIQGLAPYIRSVSATNTSKGQE